MPNFKVHLNLAIYTFPLFFLIYNGIFSITTNRSNISIDSIILGFILYIIGSDFPDIDHEFSFINKIFEVILDIFFIWLFFDINFFFDTLQKYIKISLLTKVILITSAVLIGKLSTYIFNKFFKHRGIWHTPLPAFLISILIYTMSGGNYKYFSYNATFFSLAFFFGYILHISADSLQTKLKNLKKSKNSS